MKRYQLLLFSVFLFSLSGCYYPEANVQKLEWLGYNKDTQSISTNVYMSVENKNLFAIPINKITYKFSIFDTGFITGVSPLSKSIPAGENTEFVIPLSIDTKKTLDIGLLLIKNKVWPWKFEGNLGVDSPLGTLDVPYSKTGAWQRPAVMDGIGDTIGKGIDLLNGLFGKDKKDAESSQ